MKSSSVSLFSFLVPSLNNYSFTFCALKNTEGPERWLDGDKDLKFEHKMNIFKLRLPTCSGQRIFQRFHSAMECSHPCDSAVIKGKSQFLVLQRCACKCILYYKERLP